MNLMDLTGKEFGRWKVIKYSGNKKWLCECSCENKTVREVDGNSLKRGLSKSCGCLQKGKTALRSICNKYPCKPLNAYIECDTYYKGCDEKERYFLISKEDYDKISKHRWNVDSRGYWRDSCTGELLHRFILNLADRGKDVYVDHINHNKSDNRRENLRIVTPHQNAINTSTSNRNTTGILGVRIDERNKWESRLCVNGKNMRLGRFNTKEEAIIARLKAEKYYLGEFAPQKHLFEEYGI